MKQGKVSRDRMELGFISLLLLGWGFLPAWLLWRLEPFHQALNDSAWRQALWQTLLTCILCWSLQAFSWSLLLLMVVILLLQPLLLLVTWPCLLFRNRVHRCDPLREKI